MAEKQSILGRIAQLTKANINALLDKAEDPQKMLDQMVRDYTNSIAEAEDAVAVTIGNLRLAEADYNDDIASAKEWGQKAAAAVAKAKEMADTGNSEAADRFNNLAKVALERQLQSEKEAKDAEPIISSQQEVVAKLKEGLTVMRSKLDELKSKLAKRAQWLKINCRMLFPQSMCLTQPLSLDALKIKSAARRLSPQENPKLPSALLMHSSPSSQARAIQQKLKPASQLFRQGKLQRKSKVKIFPRIK